MSTAGSYTPGSFGAGKPPADGATSTRPMSFGPQAQLYAQGSQATRALRITSGKVRLIRETGLKRIIVDDVGPGTMLGFSEALTGGTYSTAAVALDATVVEPVSADELKRQVAALPPAMQSQVAEQARREQRLLTLAEAPSVEQSFLGICRGLELLMPVGSAPQAESALLGRLRELFGMPSGVLRRVLQVLADLNLIVREQQGPMEAMLRIEDPRLMERARGLVDRWISTLPSVLTKDAPREPFTVDELAAELGVDSKAILRRMMGSDFPSGILRFDAEGVAGVRAMYGDGFFKKKVTSKDLVSEAQSVDELTGLDVAVLREFVPQMDLTRLCQLMTRVEDNVREHLLGALTPRMRRVAQSEISAMAPISDAVFADIESEIMEKARSALGGR